MLLPVILAFDIRSRLGLKAGCTATVDVNVWQQAEGEAHDLIRDEVARLTGRKREFLRSPFDLTFLTCIPKIWIGGAPFVGKGLVLVAFASSDIGPERKALRMDLQKSADFGCDILYNDIVDAGWYSLGYDICDDTLSTSLLYTSWNHSVLPACTSLLNEYGLLPSVTMAREYAKSGSMLIPEHDCFSPVEILVAP